MSRLIACLVLALTAGPGAACINDRELPGAEREFRSQYQDTDPRRPASPQPTAPGNTLLAGAGTALLIMAFGLVVTRRRPRD